MYNFIELPVILDKLGDGKEYLRNFTFVINNIVCIYPACYEDNCENNKKYKYCNIETVDGKHRRVKISYEELSNSLDNI